MPRHQRILSETGTYHIMMRGNERKDLFRSDDDKKQFLQILFDKKKETGFAVYAFCLMDNHVHILIKESEESLATTMKRVNASYAIYFNQKYHRVGHLFQDRFRSEPIEDEQYLIAVVRYIHNNPVKAGIVASLEHYKWSSYNFYLIPDNTESRNIDTEFVLSFFSNNQQQAIQEFIRFSMETDHNEYLDITDKATCTLEEGQIYLGEYLNKEWQGKNLAELIAKTEIRKEIIAHLRGRTGLSVRQIADLLGIKRGSVQNVKPKPIEKLAPSDKE